MSLFLASAQLASVFRGCVAVMLVRKGGNGLFERFLSCELQLKMSTGPAVEQKKIDLFNSQLRSQLTMYYSYVPLRIFVIHRFLNFRL